MFCETTTPKLPIRFLAFVEPHMAFLYNRPIATLIVALCGLLLQPQCLMSLDDSVSVFLSKQRDQQSYSNGTIWRDEYFSDISQWRESSRNPVSEVLTQITTMAFPTLEC